MDKRLVTKRMVLHVGFSCNARCRFCYYKDDLACGNVRDLTTEEIKSRLKEGRRFGKNQVELSGGEPTIRKDIFEIADFARESGYKTICIITNGLRTYDLTFCKKLKKAGVNEFLFSLHSPVEKEHDWLTRIKGSWKKVIKSIKNAEKLNISYRTNTVVSNINYNHLDKLYSVLKDFKPSAVNLLVYNPSTAQFPEKGEIVDYNIVGKKIKSFINKYESHFKVINIRWLPFCFLKGKEKNIRTQWQKFYEDQEWDPYLNIKFNKGFKGALGSFIGGLFLYYYKAPRYGKRDLYTKFNEVISAFRMFFYYKQRGPCKHCALRKICTGLPKNYKNDNIKLKPYRGRVIRDPLHFCRDYKNNFESLRLE